MNKIIIKELGEMGQSIWFDSISRSMLKDGKIDELAKLGVRGITTNPAIFNQAISRSETYDEEIVELKQQGKSLFEIYDELTVQDVQEAADIFKDLYEETNGRDGYVSLEIDPRLASKSKESIAEGRRLFRKAGRPNVMIKVPATEAGFEVIEELLAEGINVNGTLIFSVEQYCRTAKSFLRGMEKLLQKNGDLRNVHSVASVFVSRVDTAVDKLIQDRQGQGKAAVANSQIIFKRYKEIFAQEKFQRLKENGAEVQRLLWASTGTKNPAYSDIKYVTELMGNGTINTVPEKTLQTFLEKGAVKETLSDDISDALAIVESLKENGIDIDKICSRLLEEGLAAFESSFESLLGAIEGKIQCKK